MRLVIIDDETNTVAEIHDNIDGAYLNVPKVRNKALADLLLNRIVQAVQSLRNLRAKDANG